MPMASLGWEATPSSRSQAFAELRGVGRGWDSRSRETALNRHAITPPERDRSERRFYQLCPKCVLGCNSTVCIALLIIVATLRVKFATFQSQGLSSRCYSSPVLVSLHCLTEMNQRSIRPDGMAMSAERHSL